MDFAIVHGFIESYYWSNEIGEHNISVLETFKYDENWPLPNIFRFIQVGIRMPLISFAMKFKSNTEDWDEWMPYFERLLGLLHVERATVIWDHGTHSHAPSYYYFREIHLDDVEYKPVGQNEWTKIVEVRMNNNIQQSEERILL